MTDGEAGPKNDLTDVAGLRAGSAEDARARTGATVVLFDRPAPCAAAVAGGGPGTRETDALRPEALVGRADAVLLSGGSVYGLEAASSVTAALGAAGRGVRLGKDTAIPPAPIVPAAILYDLANGGDKSWGETPPYGALGLGALADAQSGDPLRQGAAGAGFGAMAGMRRGGLGSASARSAEGATVAALVAVNCFGAVTMPGTDTYWAWPFEIDGEFGGRRPGSHAPSAQGWPVDAKSAPGAAAGPANTTLVLVATDAALDRAETQRLAEMATAGLARAIRPVFAPMDGDVVFAASTEARSLGEPRPLALAALGALAADAVARAVARGVFAAEGTPF